MAAGRDTPDFSYARILIVDDFANWRAKTREILALRPGSKVVSEVCDGVQAVEKAAQLQPDIVIIDIGLPLMNGIEAAKLIRRRSHTTAIVFLSANTDPDVQQEALSVGHAYVLKSEASIELLAAIKTAQAAASNRESDFNSQS